MELSVREAAKILAVRPRTIYQWLEQGDIPVHRVNDQYRFNRGELLEWATARGLPVSIEHFHEETSGDDVATLVQALVAGGIHREIGGEDRESALRAVVAVMPLPADGERELLFQLLLARETMGSTAIGGGIAIPHARNPIVLHVTRPAISLCFLAHDADFAALDGRRVNTLFTLVTPTIRTHLNLLARLSAALHDRGFKDAVLARANDERILSEARRIEAGLLTPSSPPKGG